MNLCGKLRISEQGEWTCGNERPCLQHGDHFCGYGNCFRMAIRKRGFLWICSVHARRPKKSSDTASVFVKAEAKP